MDSELPQIRLPQLDWSADNVFREAYHFDDYHVSRDAASRLNAGGLQIRLEPPTAAPSAAPSDIWPVPRQTDSIADMVLRGLAAKNRRTIKNSLPLLATHVRAGEAWRRGFIDAQYDCQIKNRDDVVSRVNQVLALTHDSYNYVVLPKMSKKRRKLPPGKSAA